MVASGKGVLGLSGVELAAARKAGNYLRLEGHFGAFFDAFDLVNFDDLVSTPFYPHEWLRLIKNGQDMPSGQYSRIRTRRGGRQETTLDHAAVSRALAEGYTLVLHGLQYSHRRIGRLARIAAEELKAAVAVNAYLTPAGEQGLNPHFDHHDVFVIQLHGSKRWSVHPPVLRNPSPDLTWSGLTAAQRADIVRQAAELTEIDLLCGDSLFLPRGTVHSAVTTGSVPSLHLTVSVDPTTHKDLYSALVRRQAAGEWMRAEFGAQGSTEEVADRFSALLAGAAPELVEDLMIDSAFQFLPPMPARVLDQVELIQNPALAERYRARPGLAHRVVSRDPEAVQFEIGGNRLTLPPPAAGCVELLLSRGGATFDEARAEVGVEAAEQIVAALLRLQAVEPVGPVGKPN
ncbi:MULTISPECIES: cupin domain-containing protein [unclassified Crossiella]|uniref:cupin domain-containing protein n=1 Tax=unclassified Crossiella TaxID=2620835 RepID=UPI00200052EB|nr:MULTISPECIES: cupin domain-containing protein [unclassified Crossiella]MCK2244325.1 cupin domain-containing protein [Crossiella sp. S99.2]MCK2257847.1 cupin domain-containing protein [Crossiella sp. S99.1]